jgi:hypothetical protein
MEILTLDYSYLGKSEKGKFRFLRTLNLKSKELFIKDPLNLEFLEFNKREDWKKNGKRTIKKLREQGEIIISRTEREDL